MSLAVSRGDVLWVDFGPIRGAVKAGFHPAVVVQNDMGNKHSPMSIVVPLTDQRQFKGLPVQVLLTSDETGLANKDSCAECGHIATIDLATQLDTTRGIVGHVKLAAMKRIDDALSISLGL